MLFRSLMIHHISIAAHHPLHVSQVLAELLQGQSVPFPGYSGSYVALAFDPQGTMVEVHPFGTALVPGNEANEAAQLLQNPAASIYTGINTLSLHDALPISGKGTDCPCNSSASTWLTCRGWCAAIEIW